MWHHLAQSPCLVFNRNSYCPKGDTHPLFTYNPHDLVPFLELKVFVDHQVPDLASLPSPRVFWTHLPVPSLPLSIKESDCKLVYFARNPKNAFISLWHFANKLRPEHGGQLSLDEAFDKFCKGVSLYGPFWDHVMGFSSYSMDKPNKVLVLKYEDLKAQPTLYLKSNIEVNKNEKLSLGEANSAFFHKGEVGDWVYYLTQEMTHQFNEIIQKKLHLCGLKF